MIKTILCLICFISLQAHSKPTPSNIFFALEDSKKTLDLKKTEFKKALFVAHDCHACHKLIKKLKKKCSNLDVTTLAVGNKKNLQSKLKRLQKLKVDRIYLGSTTQAYADIGIDLMPYYISSTGEKFESGVYTAMMSDGVCKKTKK